MAEQVAETPKRRARDIVYENGATCSSCPLTHDGVCQDHALRVERDTQLRVLGRWGLGLAGGFVVMFFSITTPILRDVARDVQITKQDVATFVSRLDIQRSLIMDVRSESSSNKARIERLESRQK
jgi:hypothetical protein